MIDFFEEKMAKPVRERYKKFLDYLAEGCKKESDEVSGGVKKDEKPEVDYRKIQEQRKREFQESLRQYTDEELLERRKREYSHNGWTASRGIFLACLSAEIKRRGL